MALTTGRTAAKFGISRTALLYYDKLGLVSPTARASNGYRLYGEEDQQRLRQVLVYRDIGVPLEQMPALLAGEHDAVHAILYEGGTFVSGKSAGLPPCRRHRLCGPQTATLTLRQAMPATSLIKGGKSTSALSLAKDAVKVASFFAVFSWF